jgi:uncharacterized membrane protein (DUF4010 family)
MLGRVVVLIALVEPSLLRTAGLPLGAMMVASLVGLAMLFRRPAEGTKDGELELSNPFDLWSAIKVTLMFAIVLLATKGASAQLGDQGLYLAAALGGTTDVDAVTISTATLASTQSVGALAATVAIVFGIAVNTLVKTGLATGIGGMVLGKRVGVVAGLVLVSGGVALAATAGLFK